MSAYSQLVTLSTRRKVNSLQAHHTMHSTHQRVHHVSKNCAKLFLLELRQISTNFDNFWQKDGKEATIMRDAPIFHLT